MKYTLILFFKFRFDYLKMDTGIFCMLFIIPCTWRQIEWKGLWI